MKNEIQELNQTELELCDGGAGGGISSLATGGKL